jgi:hypothetical protein
VRSAIQSVPADQQDQVLRSLWAEVIDAAYDSGRIVGVEDVDAPLRLEIRFHKDQYGTTAGNFLLVRLPWKFNDSTANALADSSRQVDFEIGIGRGFESKEVRMELPPGYEVQDLKPEVKGECPYATYRFTYRLEGKYLLARCEEQQTAFRVPVSDLKAYQAFLVALAAEGNRQLVLKKSETGK